MFTPHTADCYPADDTATPSDAEEKEPVCGHVCSEESGCITKTLDCKHEHKVNGGEADREGGLSHDEACGYVPATEGTPCTYVCEICNAQDSGNPATPSDAQPEECTCETLCTEEEINADCPVCSVEGAELDKVCVGAAPMLPVTALAAEGAPDSLYVGNQQVISGNDITYWTTDTDGKLTASTESGNWNVKYDQTTATLTLNGATIKGGSDVASIPYGAGIYAQCNDKQSVALTIELIGTNTITGHYGIYVNAHSGNSIGTDATLLIKNSGDSSDSGSLTVTGTGSHGLCVVSGTGNASLNIKNVAVTSSTDDSYSTGAYVQSGPSATGSPNISLAVNGGSLTASGGTSGDGIQFYVGSSQATGATTSLTVSDNAIVRAENGIKTGGVDKPTPSGTGIVFDGTDGTVYGDVTLQDDLTINQGETLTVPSGASLNCNGKLTNNGTIIVEKGGNLTGNPGGKVIYAPAITNHPQDVEVKENETANFTVEATGADLSYQWQQNMNGSGWTDITGETNATCTTGKTTMDMNGTQYRCVVKNSIDEVTSDAATLTVNSATVYVTGVTLDRETLELYTGQSETLTATVEPGNATNKNVTWQSSNAQVATVENGKVTAVAAGTATIYATAADGSGKTATCTVTVLVPVSSVTMSRGSLRIYEGRSYSLSATVSPADAADKSIVWSSSDESIATVDQDGKVTGKAPGVCTIYAQARDGSGAYASCTVRVLRWYPGAPLSTAPIWGCG